MKFCSKIKQRSVWGDVQSESTQSEYRLYNLTELQSGIQWSGSESEGYLCLVLNRLSRGTDARVLGIQGPTAQVAIQSIILPINCH